MNKLYVITVLPSGYGEGVMPEMEMPPTYGNEDYMMHSGNYGLEKMRWTNHLASLPKLLLHPSLNPIPNSWVEEYQEGYEVKDQNGRTHLSTDRTLYDKSQNSDRRKVLLPLSAKKEDTGVGEMEAFGKVISDRINYFTNRYHKYEANELHNALNVILRLVPPSSFSTSLPSTSATKETEKKDNLFRNEFAESLIEGAKEVGRIVKHNVETADKIHDLYHELPDCPLKKHLALWFEYTPSQLPPLEPWEKGLVEDAVNNYFHIAVDQLGKKDLGDIERKNWEGIKKKCELWFRKYPV